MVVYGVILLLMGGSLVLSVVYTARWLHRRFDIPYALLTVGIITYTVALVVQFVLIQFVDRALLGILAINALLVGLAAGFVEETTRLFGYQYLARSTVTKPQALMVGLGHALSDVMYPGLLAIGIALRMFTDAGSTADAGGKFSTAAAEALSGMLLIPMHLALSWLVLQVFLRGEVYWLFVAVFLHTTAEIMAVLIDPDSAWLLTLWRALMALFSLGVLLRLEPPRLKEP
ncbi:MAG: YhfC family intramembrane metalloprotease [Chloroflexi bacterium]|nr:YhfC family intramembrane metalloprotease [Chloroflexota bacterium]